MLLWSDVHDVLSKISYKKCYIVNCLVSEKVERTYKHKYMHTNLYFLNGRKAYKKFFNWFPKKGMENKAERSGKKLDFFENTLGLYILF